MLKQKLYLAITIFFLLTQFFPPLGYVLPVGGALDIAVFVGLSLILYPKILLRRSMIALFLYGVIIFFLFLSGNAFFKSFDLVVIPILNMMAALYIFEYATSYDKDFKYTKIVIIVVAVFNALMALLSIPQLLINPNIIRIMDDANVTDAMMGSAKYLLLTKYATLHGLPFLFAPIAFLIRKMVVINKTKALFWIFILAVLFALLVLANSATAFLMAAITMLLGFFIRFEKFTRENVWKMIILAGLGLLLIRPSVIIPVIDVAQSFMPDNGATSIRLEELKDAYMYGESDGDLEIRQNLYNTSQSLFFESPLIGTQRPEQISNHTWIWDRLACLGIFMIIPLAMVFVFHMKKAYGVLCRTKVVYTFGAIALITMLYYKNEFGMGTWLYGFAILPLLCRYIDSLLNTSKLINKKNYWCLIKNLIEPTEKGTNLSASPQRFVILRLLQLKFQIYGQRYKFLRTAGTKSANKNDGQVKN